ncbi:MAG: leucine-rich repeat protein [Bacteroidaceae bacterium]|nr:leucine-rich repeat protein [Bacteroidaceae bacterium]
MKKTFKLMLAFALVALGSTSAWAANAFTDGQEIKVASIPEYVFQVIGDVDNTKTTANVKLVALQEGKTAADIIKNVGSNNLGEIYFPKEFEYTVNSKTYTMRVVAFDGEIFNNLDKAGSITIPKWVQSIPNYAFKGDTELGTITFEEGSRVTKIGEHCFTTTKIEVFDFSPCNYLEELPNQVFVEAAPNVNSFIKKVTLPTSPYFKHINGAFQRMEALTEIENLENSYVKELIAEAFTGCKKLTEISLGIRMRYIDNEALKGSAITTLSIKVGDKDVVQDAGIVLLGGVKVERNGSTDVNASYDYTPTDATTNLYGQNVNNATPLTTLTLTGKLTGKISPLSFAWCDKLNETLDLTGMELGSTGQILTDAFKACYYQPANRGIVTVKVADISNNTSGGYTIDSNAFEGCTKLEAVEIGNISTIDAIGSTAFGNQLKTVKIGSVESTGASFAGKVEGVPAVEPVEATPGVYSFTSYGVNFNQLATGTVTAEQTEDVTAVEVVTNSVEGFVGNTYYLDPAAAAEDGKYYELYNDEDLENATGIFVQIGEKTEAVEESYAFTSYDSEQDGNQYATGTVSVEDVKAIEVTVVTNSIEADPTFVGKKFYLAGDVEVGDEVYPLYTDKTLKTVADIYVTINEQLTEEQDAALATYSFTSYADAEGETVWATGVVTATEVTSVYKVTVVTNSVEGFVGGTYYIQSDAGVGDTRYQLYSDAKLSTETGIYVVINSHTEAAPATYAFTSYEKTYTEWATGKVNATIEEEYVSVEVTENSIDGFVGNSYYLDPEAGVGETKWALYTNAGLTNEAGIYVTINEELEAAVEAVEGKDEIPATDPAFIWKNVSGTSLEIAQEGQLSRRAAEINDDGSAAIPEGTFDFSPVVGQPGAFVWPTLKIGKIESKGGVFADGAIIPSTTIGSLTFTGSIAENGLDAAIIAGEDYAGLSAITFEGNIGKGGIATGAFANMYEGQIKTLTFGGVLAGEAIADGAFNYPVLNEEQAAATAEAKMYKLQYTQENVADFAVNPFAKKAFVKVTEEEEEPAVEEEPLAPLRRAVANDNEDEDEDEDEDEGVTAATPRYILLEVANEDLANQYKDEDWGLTTDQRFDIYLVKFYEAPEDPVTERKAFLVYRDNKNGQKIAWGRYDLGSFANEKPYPTYEEEAAAEEGYTYRGVNTDMWIDRYQKINGEVVKVTLYGIYTDEDFNENAKVSTVYMVPLQVVDGQYKISKSNKKLIIVKAEKKDGSELTGANFNEFDITYNTNWAIAEAQSSVWTQLPNLRTDDTHDVDLIGKSQGMYTNQQMWDGVSGVPSIWEGSQNRDNAPKTTANNVEYASKALHILLNPANHKGFDVEKTTITKSVAPGVDANLPNGRNGGYINKGWYYALLHEFAPVEPKLTEEATTAPARVVWLDDDQATAIFGVKEDAMTTTDSKFNGAIYNLQGVRVDESYKGIVIKNGKKYLQK